MGYYFDMRKVIQTVISVLILGIIIEISAPVIDEKYAFSNWMRLIMGVEKYNENDSIAKNTNSKIGQESQLREVMSVHGFYFDLPLGWVHEPSLDPFESDLPNDDKVPEKYHKLKELVDEMSGKRVDIIYNELFGKDNLINIYKANLPYRETVEGISKYCDGMNKMIMDLSIERKAEIYECVEDNRMKIGTDHKYAIFDSPGTSGENMRYYYTFYFKNDQFIQIVSECVKSEGTCGDTENVIDIIVRGIRMTRKNLVK